MHKGGNLGRLSSDRGTIQNGDIIRLGVLLLFDT